MTSRPPGVSKGGDQWEVFKGRGETLGGRKTKGRGVSHRKVEEVAEGSKIIRTEYDNSRVFSVRRSSLIHLHSKHRVVTNNSLEADVTAPAPLNLPFGKLFFGFKMSAYTPPEAPASPKPKSPVRRVIALSQRYAY